MKRLFFDFRELKNLLIRRWIYLLVDEAVLTLVFNRCAVDKAEDADTVSKIHPNNHSH